MIKQYFQILSEFRAMGMTWYQLPREMIRLLSKSYRDVWSFVLDDEENC